MPALPPVIVPRFRFRRGALEPQGIFVDQGDTILLRTLLDPTGLSNLVSIEARIRILDPRLLLTDYRIAQIVGPGRPAEQANGLTVTQGFIQGATVGAITSEGETFPAPMPPGVIYCQLSIGRGAPTPFYDHTLLAAGYLNRLSSLGWPGGEPASTNEGPGAARTFTFANPAAGAEIPGSIGTSGVIEYDAISFVLTTSAAVASREVRLLLNGGGGTAYLAGGNVVQGAGLAWRYSIGADLPQGKTSTDTVSIPIPHGLRRQSLAFETSTLNLQAGDQFSGINGILAQWLP